MELKRNRILKRRNLPKYKDGADIGSMVQNGVGFAGSVINTYSGTPTTQLLTAQAGNQVGYGSGFQYNRIGSINSSLLMRELSASNTSNTLNTMGTGAALGGSVGMAFGPIGAGIGAAAGAVIGGAVGLFGGASRKEKLRRRITEAQNLILRTNDYRLASALSNYMLNLFELEHGDTQGGLIYAANRGKDLVRPKRTKR